MILELVCDADLATLNKLIRDHRIDPARIISIILQPAKALAIGDYKPKFRVLYYAAD
jgi:hypothetical protein